MDINNYKTTANILGVALIFLPIAVLIIQAKGDRVKAAERQAIINALPGNPDPGLRQTIFDLDKKSTKYSIINIFFLAISIICGITLLVANSKIQDNDERSIEKIGNDQRITNENEARFKEEISSRVDFLSSRIKGEHQQNLSLPKQEAFKTLESLGNKKICLVQVGFERETTNFYSEILKSISSYDENVVSLTIGNWTTIAVGEEGSVEDSHHEIQVFDPVGQNGPFYKAIRESGLPTNLISSLPMGCGHVDYGLVIGRN